MPLADSLQLYLQNLHFLFFFVMIAVDSIMHAEYYVPFEISCALRILQYNLKADYKKAFHILLKVMIGC